MADLRLILRLDALDKATKPLRNLQGAINDTSKAAAAQRKRFQELQKTINNAPASKAQFDDMVRMRKEMEKTNQAILKHEKYLKQLARVRDARRDGKQMMMNGSMRVMAAMGAGYGAARFLSGGMQFDTTMSRVQSLARLDKNSTQMQALREQAKYLNQTTWADAQQVASGQAFYAMAGFTPDAIMKAMPGTLDLAKASGLEIGRAADIGSNILQAFGLKPEEMGRAVDTLVGTFTRANVDMEMLGESMKYAAPVAKTLGISMEQSAAMAGMLGNVGIQGGQAGRAMKQIYSRLADATPAGKKALKQLGIKTTDEKGNLREVPVLLTEIFEKTKTMGNAERMGMLKRIAGDIAAPAFASLMDETTLENFKKMYEDIKKAHANNEAYNVVRKMEDNLEGDIIYLKAAWSDFQISIFETNNVGLRDTIKQLTSIMNTIGAFAKKNPELIKNLSKIVGGAIAITAAIGGITMALGFLKFAIVGHPIIALLTLVVFLGMQIHDNFDDLVWLWKEGFGRLQVDIGNLLSKIPVIGGVLKFIWDSMSSGLGVIKDLIQLIFDLFTDWDGTVLRLQGHWDDLCMNVKRFWNDIVTWAQPAIDKLMAIIQPFIDIYRELTGRDGRPSTNAEAITQMVNKNPVAADRELMRLYNNNILKPNPGIENYFPAEDFVKLAKMGKYDEATGRVKEYQQTVNQTNTININGAGDPKAVGQSVVNSLSRLNTDNGAKMVDAF